MEGKSHQLQLGWHMLRNPGQAELNSQSENRERTEKDFFANADPWTKLNQENVGVDALRSRLREILAGHIRREFPKVKSEIVQRLKTANTNLQTLGPKRQSETDQREFLMKAAIEYQRIADQAVRSDYSHAGIFDSDKKLRLATESINRGEKFSEDVEQYGHTFHFAPDDNFDSIPEEDDSDIQALDDLRITNDGIDTRCENSHPDTEDIVQRNETVPHPLSRNILSWLKKVHHESRGFELGTFDASLLHVALKRQAYKWHDLALGYISDIVTLVHDFIVKVLRSITPNHRVQRGVVELLMVHLEEKYKKAMDHIRFLLKVELDGTPATHNHYFNDVLEKRRQERLRQRLEEKSFSDCKHGNVVRLEDVAQTHPLNNSDHTVIEIHDILNSYYKLARKRFVDCARMQVADFLLVTGSDSPLAIFSATFVAAMSPEHLEEIAGEEVAGKRQRSNLEKEIGKLMESRKILG
ncbi:MAG: hypothetical protein Q9198_009465 [Flavoplaca austrocitrina]